MGEKIIVGPLNHGLRNNRTPFVIDNDSFPVLINAYQWRGRVKRKRGTSLLNRLRRFFNSLSAAYNAGSTTLTLDGSGSANLITGFSLETNASLTPGTITIIDTTAGNTYTDPGLNGILVGNPAGTGTINYATGAFTITGGAAHVVNANFNYYPVLPVLGLEDFTLATNAFPGTLGFDNKYSYNIQTTYPYTIYDVSFYKNISTGTYPGYIQKTTWTPTTWNGQDYQQFWSTNYQNAFWVTNGINIPFSITNIGMQYKFITGVSIGAAGPPALVTLTITAHGLVVGDFIYVNEVGGVTGINGQTGYVTVVGGVNSVTVEFPNATIAGAFTSGGIAQYLTSRADSTKDSLRWYDGDPTNGNVTTPGFQVGKGWVNFAPPLSSLNYNVALLPLGIYYLVGARMIIPYKDRLLFFGPVIQTSAAGSQVYLQDTVIFSQNGTPYYTASFTGDPSLATTVFTPLLVPSGQTASPTAFWEDQTGFGGYQSAGTDQNLTSVASENDVLICGFTNTETKLVYTENDVKPFSFYEINSQLGTSSTFSTVNMEDGVITRGDRGIINTSETKTDRVDLEIPDEVFQMSLLANGTERVTAQRDFINEWVYITYPVNNKNSSIYKFPNQTLLYNYNDNSWAIFQESYTHYGAFKKQTGFTWATVGAQPNPVFPTWGSWNQPWNAGASTLLQPEVIAGNQQGFVMVRDDGTNEGTSLMIQNIAGSVITSPNHGLNAGDYITITGVLGTSGTFVNNQIFSVSSATLTANTFLVNPPISSGTYLGGGLIKRMYIPFIQTKQFPTAWGMGLKTRLGPQQYLLTTTSNAQIQLLIYLSQDADNAYNDSPIVPATNSTNNSLIYSTVLYTCPESTNLGLTPANTNLQMITQQSGNTASSPQSQTWHRMNTSLIGDTVQVGFSLSDAQMRDTTFTNQFAEIELHGMILDTNPSSQLA